MNNLNTTSEYKLIQRELEKKAKRGFRFNSEILHEGVIIRDFNKREYIIAADGSWRRRDKKER